MDVLEVPVGEYLSDGRFLGEGVDIDGRQVSVADGLHTDTVEPDAVYGYILRLYECLDGYRVHELIWSPLPGRTAVASLYPLADDRDGYATYTEQEVMEEWGEFFQEYFHPSS